jgi:hypothetical protein
MRYFFGFQQQLRWGMVADVAYVGNEGTHLQVLADYNQATPCWNHCHSSKTISAEGRYRLFTIRFQQKLVCNAHSKPQVKKHSGINVHVLKFAIQRSNARRKYL